MAKPKEKVESRDNIKQIDNQNPTVTVGFDQVKSKELVEYDGIGNAQKIFLLL